MTNIKRYIIDKGYGQWKGVSQLFIIHYSLFFLSFMTMTACSDDLTNDTGVTDNDGKGIGEMVQFASGTTQNSVTTRASEARTYYMPDGYRFVARMYYKAQVSADTFDITGGSDRTAWLKVKGTVGNSLYWNKAFDDVAAKEGEGGVDKYGNDFSAPAFYWQNRKEHAFLAWTDLNNASAIVGGESQGQLKFTKDETYRIYTGATTMKWITKSYELCGVDQSFNSLAEIQEYLQQPAGSTTVGETDDFKTKQEAIGSQYDWTSATYYYQHGWQHKHSESNADYDYKDVSSDVATTREYGWIQYQMFFEKLPFDGEIPIDADKVYDEKNHDIVTFIKDHLTHRYLAYAEVRKDSEGNFLDKGGNVTTEPANYAYDYYLTDEYGNIKYNESKPRYTFYYKEYQNKENIKIEEEYPVLAFDLTRGDKTSMAQQPDIVQAVEIQAPTGASQESNRVNLYFRHQFSQLQVNVKNAADNSVTIEREDILKVELLGVTEKGYVFTELDAEGKVKATTYEDIDFSKFTEMQLRENQFGTSLQMFELSEAETPSSYLKSFNGIAFGQLQAIRITWKESGSDGNVHAATYRVPDKDPVKPDVNLRDLQSGVRYVWNIEIRRGTLAIIRTEIVDWELPKEAEYNGSADGMIHN